MFENFSQSVHSEALEATYKNQQTTYSISSEKTEKGGKREKTESRIVCIN